MIALGKKLLATLLAAALLVLAPGLDAYQAAAADLAGPADAGAGAEAGFAGFYAASSLSRPLDLSNPAAITSTLSDVRDLARRLQQARAQAAPDDVAALDSAINSADGLESALSSYQQAAAGNDASALSSSAQALKSQWESLRSAVAAPSTHAALNRPAAVPLKGLQERESALSDQLAYGASPEGSAAAARQVLDGPESADSAIPILPRGLTQLVARDMALNPEAWAPLDVEKTVAKLGPQAVEKFNETRREAPPEPSRALELRFESPRTGVLLAVAAGVSWIPFLGTIAVHEAGHFMAARALGVRVDHVVLFKATRSLRNVKGEVAYDTAISPAKDIAILLAGPVVALLNASAKLFTALEVHHLLGRLLIHGTTLASVASGGTITLAVLAAGSLVYALSGFSLRPGSDLGQALQRLRQRGDSGGGNGVARSILNRADEWIYLAAFFGAAAFGLNLLHFLFAGTVLFPAAAATIAFGAGMGGVQLIRELRSEVVGGWQASHDQKYRVGPDGNLRDVRGHKYGEDRYEATAPGQAKPWESFLLQAAAFAGGLWLAYGSAVETAVYVGAFALSAAAARLFSARRSASAPNQRVSFALPRLTRPASAIC